MPLVVGVETPKRRLSTFSNGREKSRTYTTTTGANLTLCDWRRYRRRMRRVCVLAFIAMAAPAVVARAADVTDVASAFDEDNPFDFRFRVRYDHTEKRAQIKRELEGLSPSQAQIAVDRDLLYSQSKDTLSLRAEFGSFKI